MYLAELEIENFRRLENVTLRLQPGLNIIVGANNVGKTAVIDSLRALLSGPEELPLRLSVDDLRRPRNGNEPVTSIKLRYTFRGLSLDDEADFLPALVPGTNDELEARITVSYSAADTGSKLHVRRWCGDHEDVALTSDMMENLRGVYLPALRDASQGLKPSRSSQLSRLLRLLADTEGREGIENKLRELDAQLKLQKPIADLGAAILSRHQSMLGVELSQSLEVGLSATDFQRLCARLSLLADTLEIEQNGLGFNNLIYMAVVLSELSKSPEAAHRALIVEEPEAHLHPQLQAVLLRSLEEIHEPKDGERPVQVFVTSHSPNFASIAKLDSLSCLVQTEKGVEAFFPRDVQFDSGKREKLERYLDVTRAELFFARRIIFVEGTAELLLLPILAKIAGYDLRTYGVSVISVEGLNFDSFLPLFGEAALRIPVSVVTDADPGEDSYPASGDIIQPCANTLKMLDLQDALVKVYHGVKTFEYDLALCDDNRRAMLNALVALHPAIGATVRSSVEAVDGDAAKAKALFVGMFERPKGTTNVQKGKFAQALAQSLASETAKCEVPQYIRKAVEHVCKSRI